MEKHADTKDKVNRNDPCPCGSGKKYKKCCLPIEDSHVDLKLQRYKETDIQLNTKLAKFAMDYLSEEEKELTFLDFFVPDRFEEVFEDAELDEKDLERIEDNMKNLYFPWLLYDYVSEEDQTFAEMYLEKMGNKLDEIQKELIKGYIDSFPSYYQVLEVQEGSGVKLKDIVIDEEFFVNDVSVSKQAVKWDILFARIIKVDKYYILAGNCMVFPPAFKDDIQEPLSDILKKCRRKLKDISYGEFQKDFVEVNNHLILCLMRRLAAKPKLVNFDGEELIFSEAHYEVIDIEKTLSKLDSIKGLEPMDISRNKKGQITKAEYGWSRTGESIRNDVSLGTLQVEKKGLTVCCNSKERLEKMKKILARNCKGSLRYKITTHQDVISAMNETKKKPISRPKGEIPIEVQKQIIEEFQSEYRRDWLDSSIPALDDLTPRQASKTKKGRRLLEELLNLIENRQLRREKEVEATNELPPPFLDVGEIRNELGLY